MRTNERTRAMQVTLLRPKDAAEVLGVAEQTLARWRVEGSGPPYTKIGAFVRYSADDLQRWWESRRRESPARSGEIPLRRNVARSPA